MAEETGEEELGGWGEHRFLLGLRLAGRWDLGGQQGLFQSVLQNGEGEGEHRHPD
jgi:hypothetical protein